MNKGKKLSTHDNIQREILPLPDIPHVRLTTYDAKVKENRPCILKPNIKPVCLAGSPADYARFKPTKGLIQPWEDGLRLYTAAPNIEWWYFDSYLDDGAILAVIFCTKNASRDKQPLKPLIEIDLNLPDGRFNADEFAASKDGCDVRIGKYHFTSDLHEYHITGAAEEVSAEAQLDATTEPWRPETGHMVFGLEGETIFAWTSFVLFGEVTSLVPAPCLKNRRKSP